MNGDLGTARRPEITVLLTTRDRAASLDRTLDSIARCMAPAAEWELIVCDNGSTDGTAAVIEKWKASLPIRSVFEARAGKNIALNAGLRIAVGSLLVFTDDDVIVDHGWLRAYEEVAARHTGKLVFGGAIEAVLPDGAPRWLLDASFAAPAFAHLPLAGGERVMEGLPFGGNFSLRREALGIATFDEKVGPDGTPNYAMGSETSCLQSLANAGHRAVAVPASIVRHVIRADQVVPNSLRQRAVRAGQGLVAQERGLWAGGAQLFGRPRWIARALARAYVRFGAAALFGSERTRAESQWDLLLAKTVWKVSRHSDT